MALADRVGQPRLSTYLFSAAQFEFHPATRHFDLDAVLAVYARSSEQPTDH